MKISERTIKRLGELITGDKKLSPYRSGPQLVRFFNELGANDQYGNGFGSRWAYAEDHIRSRNDTPDLRKVVLSAFDPRDFMGATVFDQATGEQQPLSLEAAVAYLNEFLSFDGYEMVRNGRTYVVTDRTRGEVLLDVKLEPDHLSHAFIVEQVDKCRTKIDAGDYDGAITNARSLVEAVLTAIEAKFDDAPPDYDGDVQRLYKRVSKHLKLSEDGSQTVDDNLKQIMRGFVNIVAGLAGISNKMGDRHVRKYKPAAHHAALIVNAAMTLCGFVFDTFEYQAARAARDTRSTPL
ncbi:abortive infection family protein [Caulobacter segnis]